MWSDSGVNSFEFEVAVTVVGSQLVSVVALVCIVGNAASPIVRKRALQFYSIYQEINGLTQQRNIIFQVYKQISTVRSWLRISYEKMRQMSLLVAS
jgi:hypothetical protein